jgi:hypothetical protein
MNMQGYLNSASGGSNIYETYYGLLDCARYVEPLVVSYVRSLIKKTLELSRFLSPTFPLESYSGHH